MANDLFVELQEKLEGKKVRIVFPEAYDERVLEAAVKLSATSYVQPVLVGKKEKVEEFNSRRICHENCEDASPGEIEKHINSIKDDKENMKIDTDEYKSVEYENYEDDIEE